MSFIQIALAQNADNAKRVIHTFNCEASLAIGDLVYIDPTDENKVLKPSDNTEESPVIGVCYAKSGDTVARILILGVQNGFTGLTSGSKIFLSASGGTSHSRPGSGGYEHILGVAVSSTEILFVPNMQRVWRV